MNDLIDTIEYKGYTIKVYSDHDFSESPREWENMGIMACWHRCYILGDIMPSDDPTYYLAKLVYDKGLLSDEQLDDYYYNQIDDNLLKKFSSKYIWLPIHAYEHSGITISTSMGYPYNDRFDGGQLGIIYVDKEKVKSEYKWKVLTKKRIERIEKQLKSEVDVYDDYLTGNVYGFIIEDGEGEEVESCWGFFGDYEKSMIPDCKSTIDYIINKHKEQARLEHSRLISSMPLFIGI